MTSALLAEVLCCRSCGGEFGDAADCLRCGECGLAFPVLDGIPVLLDDTSASTVLDRVDYEKTMGIDAEVVRSVAIEWGGILERVGAPLHRVLEIGAGTGVLTRALANRPDVRELVATDVSVAFLRRLASVIVDATSHLVLVACDANQANFREGAFGTVVGRSVLHHLLDYPETLRRCCASLEPGGVAVFYEPILEGKTVTTLFMSLMLRIDEVVGDRERLTEHERSMVAKQIRHQMKSTFLPQDRETLARLEDKYIFEIDEMKSVGRAAGFSEVAFIDDPRDLPYWAYVAHTCSVVGVPSHRIDRYRWIEDEFRATYGTVFPDRLPSPVGYFVFRR